jgi:hypothetical protein
MELKIVLSLIFIILFCAGRLVTRANLPISERPLMYFDYRVRIILNIVSILLNIFFIFFIFFDWKLLIFLVLFCLTIGSFFITPLIEKLLCLLSIKSKE